MAKKTYIGVNGTARRVNKIYIGIGGVARKIKKAYIGIGGVARPCFSVGLDYYGRITPLSVARYGVSAASAGHYALFSGGVSAGATSSVVDAYNASLTRSSAPSLDNPRYRMAAAAAGNLAIFAGGSNIVGSVNGSVAATDVYDCSSSTKIAYSNDSRYYGSNSHMAATSVGNYAIFAGGVGVGGRVYPSCSYYDASGTGKSLTSLSEARYKLAATSVGNFAIFAGGNTDYFHEYKCTNVIDAYNKEGMTKMTVPFKLSTAKTLMAATSVGNYAIFAGGFDIVGSVNEMDCINDSLTGMTSHYSKHVEKIGMAATSVGNYAIFAGGSKSVDYSNHKVDSIVGFDSSLSPTLLRLSEASYNGAAATIGNYAIFAGGVGASAVEACVVSQD